MMGLAIRLAFTAISALSPAGAAEQTYCIGTVEILRIERDEARIWPFAARAGTLICDSTGPGQVVRYAPDGVSGAHAVLSRNPFRQAVTLVRHPDYFAPEPSPGELAGGIRFWRHAGSRLCERRRAATIRPCFK